MVRHGGCTADSGRCAGVGAEEEDVSSWGDTLGRPGADEGLTERLWAAAVRARHKLATCSKLRGPTACASAAADTATLAANATQTSSGDRRDGVSLPLGTPAVCRSRPPTRGPPVRASPARPTAPSVTTSKPSRACRSVAYASAACAAHWVMLSTSATSHTATAAAAALLAKAAAAASGWAERPPHRRASREPGSSVAAAQLAAAAHPSGTPNGPATPCESLPAAGAPLDACPLSPRARVRPMSAVMLRSTARPR